MDREDNEEQEGNIVPVDEQRDKEKNEGQEGFGDRGGNGSRQTPVRNTRTPAYLKDFEICRVGHLSVFLL